ncbi:hypothetical protein EPUS_07446 [Endocarpon pusillum Z07020]|uniref:Spherulin 4-like cell surface protein n=1 Tax=Endocarpon pusillum (strain Z07020 / HMAS-L-300199) TaxID=1263415 RepID=U1GJG3_ENDPU|nr:uncharacterized protein EPUS_07446 [Endocarpon pusillum Z07020]ERF71976.1 hypothetical protein EPUS_07446 [Endocarpon pusillum Z07020]
MKGNDAIISQILRRKRKRFWYFSLAIVFLVILAVVLPVAFVFSRRRHPKGLKSTVLVPLYIYPIPGAWEPLHEAIIARPNLNFTVIINPDSGPGSTRYPSSEYTSEVQRLNVYPNVRMMGYVRIGYAKRNLTEVLEDISTYSGWSVNPNATDQAVHGIFFDETPNEYTSEVSDYLKSINQAAKNAAGLLPARTIIHNPGSIPDARLTDADVDITVVFEASYQEYQEDSSSKALRARLASLPIDRSRVSCIMFSVRTGMSQGDRRSLADELSQHAEFLYLTDLSQNYYESFGPHWQDFIAAIPT